MHRSKILILMVGWFVALSRGGGAEELPARGAVQALIERQAAAWETGNETEFLATLHPDVVFAYPGKRLNRDGALRIFRDWKRDFRATALRVHRVVIDGARFAVEYTFATTNVATGRRTAAGTVAFGEVRDGKLFLWKEYLDGRVSRQQAAGELPVDEQAEPFPWPDTPESRQP
jgi:ketosteroid isomerase-like protein